MEELKSVDFAENKYTKWYFSIIDKAKKRNLSLSKNQVQKIQKTFGYTEVHHIIPRSIGGSNHKNNLIRLLAKEHYICHLLLTKMAADSVTKKKMVTAYIIMSGKNSKSARIVYRRLNSRLYAKIREEYSQYQSVKQTGRIVSSETKKKLSESRKGIPLSGETKEKLSKIFSGRKRPYEMTDKIRERMSKSGKAKKMPESFKKKISEIVAGTGNPFYGKKHSAESLEKMLAYHNNEEVRKQKSLRVQGENNPAKRPEVREKIRATMAAKRAAGWCPRKGKSKPKIV